MQLSAFTLITTIKFDSCCIPGTVHNERFYNVFLYVVPIALTNMMCTGNENAISECSYKRVDGNHGCTHRDDMIVNCFGK